jgi:hypothetical protein
MSKEDRWVVSFAVNQKAAQLERAPLSSLQRLYSSKKSVFVPTFPANPPFSMRFAIFGTTFSTD